ncbi:MAG: hypothetical protein HY721_04520, partial [Planctomycetes bacterium]|nr:hypothetical protein [Planctomycetota bacterium]
GGSFASLGTGGGGSSKPHDSLHDNLFTPNQQSIGNVTVKYTITDGERMIDLNRIFDYVRLPEEEVEPEAGGAAGGAGGALLSEEEMVGAVAGKSEEAAATSLREKALSRIRDRREKAGGKASAAATGAGAGAEGGVPGAVTTGAGGDLSASGTDAAAQALSDYEPLPFPEPEPERVELTKEMVSRALLMMFSINEFKYGYTYSRKYDARAMASNIVDYVHQRRASPFQNRIYLVTELLNITPQGGQGAGDVTPEVFYGPVPRVTGEEPILVGDGFELRVDEFGDVVPEYIDPSVDPVALKEEKRLLEELQTQYGQFADFPGLGLSRLASNPITRGMQEPAIAMDQDGSEYLVEVPKAIGLKDIFTTFSSGKININTASVPVLYALLRSLSDEDANLVALDIDDYRRRFQEEVDEEGGVSDVTAGSETPDLGQPKRRKRDEEEEKKKAAAAGAAGSSSLAGAGGIPGVDPALLEEYSGSSYQDLELNYFSSLEQVELIDGTDGSRDDRLRRDEGVEKVSKEDEESLFRRVIRDLEKVAVFSSTYYSAELKSKPKEGKGVKTGYLTVRRDAKTGMLDILMWKNLQK